MIYDAVEAAYAVIAAQFNYEFGVLAAAKGIPCDTTADIIKRQPADVFIYLKAPLPAVGVYGLRAFTQAKNQQRRYNSTTIVADYFARGTDYVLLAKQTELAAEVLLLCIDAMTPSSGGVYGVGEEPGAVTVELSEGVKDAPAEDERVYERRAQVTFVVHDEDVV